MLKEVLIIFFVWRTCECVPISAKQSAQEYRDTAVRNSDVMYTRVMTSSLSDDNARLSCPENYRILVNSAHLGRQPGVKGVPQDEKACGLSVTDRVRQLCFKNGVKINKCRVSAVGLTGQEYEGSAKLRCGGSDEIVLHVKYMCYEVGKVIEECSTPQFMVRGSHIITPSYYGNIVPAMCMGATGGIHNCPKDKCSMLLTLERQAKRAKVEMTLLDLSLYPGFEENKKHWGQVFDPDRSNGRSVCKSSEESDVLQVMIQDNKTKKFNLLAEWCSKSLKLVPHDAKSLVLDGEARSVKIQFNRDMYDNSNRRGFLLLYRVSWCPELVAPDNTSLSYTADLSAELHCIPGTHLPDTEEQVQRFTCSGDGSWTPGPRACVPLPSTPTSTPGAHLSSTRNRNSTTGGAAAGVWSSPVVTDDETKMEVTTKFQRNQSPVLRSQQDIFGLLGGVFGGLGFAIALSLIIVLLVRHRRRMQLKERTAHLRRLAGNTTSMLPLLTNGHTLMQLQQQQQQRPASRHTALPPLPDNTEPETRRSQHDSQLRLSRDENWNHRRRSLDGTTDSLAPPLPQHPPPPYQPFLQENEKDSIERDKMMNEGLTVRLPPLNRFNRRFNSYGDDIELTCAPPLESDHTDGSLRRAPSAETYLEPNTPAESNTIQRSSSISGLPDDEPYALYDSANSLHHLLRLPHQKPRHDSDDFQVNPCYATSSIHSSYGATQSDSTCSVQGSTIQRPTFKQLVLEDSADVDSSSSLYECMPLNVVSPPAPTLSEWVVDC